MKRNLSFETLESIVALDATAIPAPIGITTPIETVTPDPASASQLQEMQNLTNAVLSDSTQNGVAPFRVTVPGVGDADGLSSTIPPLPGNGYGTGLTPAVSDVSYGSLIGTVGGTTPVVTNYAPAPYDVAPAAVPIQAVVLGTYGGPDPTTDPGLDSIVAVPAYAVTLV